MVRVVMVRLERGSSRAAFDAHVSRVASLGSGYEKTADSSISTQPNMEVL